MKQLISIILISLFCANHSKVLAQRTIQSIYVTFNTTNDDKDWDTWIRFQVQSSDGSWLGTQEGTFGGSFPNNSSYTYALTLGNPYYKEYLLSNSYFYVLMIPNGHDTWNFGWIVTVIFNDGTRRVATGTGGLNETNNSFKLGLF